MGTNEIDRFKVEWIPINKLHKNPKNTNKHPKDQIERLAKILDYQGWRWPIIADENNMIIAGEGRWLSAKHNKYKKVPVMRQDFVDEDQLKSFVTSDNAIASWAEIDMALVNEELGSFDPSFDIELLGLKDFTVDVAEKYEPGIDEDDVPEPTETVCKPGDLWILGEHRLLCGDSTNIQHVERLMGGEKADMVFTDPPYGMDFIKSSGVLSKNYEQYENEDSDQCAIDFINLCLSLNLNIMAFGGNYFAHALPKSTHWLVWDKRGENMQGGNKNGDQSDCEIMWTNLKKKNVKTYKHVWAGWFRKGNKKDELKTKVHPSQKPVGLFENIFNDYDFRSCFDGFGGSGSTLIACEKTNRKCYMMELDPHYCDVIINRWEKYSGKKAELYGKEKEEN